MPDTRPWTVTPHGPLEKFDDNLWGLSSAIPNLGAHRRMIILRRTDGTLLFINAVPMDDAVRSELEAWGKPTHLVVTHDQHCIDAEAFRKRLGVQVYGPKGVEAKVRERVELTGTFEALPPDPSFTLEELPFVKLGEPVLTVKSAGGISLVFSDVFQNGDPATIGFKFRLLGFAGPRTPPIYKLQFLTDKAALRAKFEAWASLPGLRRIVPSHGLVVEGGEKAAQTLREAARRV
jgi:hypothetical protein